MSWRILNLDLPNVPKILVKCRLDSSGYQIELTDLSRIWTDSASKDEIIQRALDVGSSIDPSEDDEQFKIFLSKIESALNCEDGTSLSATSGGGDGSSLQLDLSAPLPRPLSPFKWTLQLRRQPEQHIEAEVVTPLVLQSSNLRRQIQQLIDELHDKDRVISKICDRLETSGNDLTTVFPGVSNIKTSRKKGQREQLAKHVKGLEDFDEDAWRRRDRRADRNDGLDTQVIDEVFRDLPSSSSKANAVVSANWWQHLGTGSLVKSTSDTTGKDTRSPKADGRGRRTGSAIEHEESQREDEFQRQGTPPHLKPNAAEEEERHVSVEPMDAVMNGHEPQVEPAMQKDDESTTDEEDDLDAPPPRKLPSQKPQSVSEQKQASPSPRKLGAIGGRSSQSAASAAAEDTFSEEVEAPKTRSKLGTIGGKSKPSAASPMSTENNELAEKSPPPKTSKMGVIGGKKGPTSNSPPPPLTESMRSPEPTKRPSPRQSRTPAKENTPPPRETSEERADRKRDRLKRELEEKAKGPAKKKRKF